MCSKILVIWLYKLLALKIDCKYHKKTLEVDVPSVSSASVHSSSGKSHKSRKSSNSTHKSEKSSERVTNTAASSSQKSYSTSIGTHRIEHSSIVEPVVKLKPENSDISDNLTSVSQQINHENKVNDDPEKGGYVIPAKQDRLLVTARHAHNSTSEKQLNFLVGDLILVLINESKSGWKYGENTRTQERGWYPETYVMEVSENDSHV